MPEPALVLFDLDGTLIASYMDRPERDYPLVAPLSGRRERLAALRADGVKVGVVTNQGGCAFGYVSEADVHAKLAKAEELLGPFDAIVCALGHPEATIPMYGGYAYTRLRKPGPHGVFEAMRAAGEHDYTRVLMVGDRLEDAEAAAAAGVRYQDAGEFFGDDRS